MMGTAMKSVDDFLNLLSKVKPIGQNQWQALCPSHTDRNPSLNIKLQNHKILIHCHTGCQPNEVAKAVGLTMADLFLNGDKPAPPVQREIVATYPYHNAKGEPIFEVVRYNPKSFSQRRFSSNGKGGYEWGLKGITPLLYRLPDVQKAITDRVPIAITEGEKDADALRALGFVATTNPMGSQKWRESYTVSLKGAQETVIFPDNDGPGRKHARQVAQSLYGAGIPVKILEMPDDTIKDVSDWLGAGADKAVIKKAMAGLPPWTPDTSTLEDGVPASKNRTDYGNAERLVDLYGEEIRYCYERKSCLIWKGTHWRWDLGGEIMRFAQKTVRSIYGEAQRADDTTDRKNLADWAKTSESNMRLNAMIEQAKPLLKISLSELDTDVFLFNCENGTIDLKTGELYKAKKSDYITVLSPVDYDPTAQSDLWDQFLDQIFPGSPNLVSYIQRCIGYTLTGDDSEQSLFFAYGTGQNGKSTLLTAYQEIMAPYALQADIETFLHHSKQSGSGHSEDVASLAGKRFVVASEITGGRRLAVSKLKQMTGGESVRASRKHEHEFEFKVTYKIWLNSNHKPTITDTTYSIWRRVKLIPFTVTIPKADQDKKLREKLREAYPALLAWAVQGCLDWQQNGLNEPNEVTNATEEYRHQQDVLGDFIEDCFVLDPNGLTGKKETKELYLTWCLGSSVEPLSQYLFKARLEERGLSSHRAHAGKHCWRGIKILTNEDLGDEKGDKGDKSIAHLASGDKTIPGLPVIPSSEDIIKEDTETDTNLVTLVTPDDEIGEVADYPTAPCYACKNKDYWLAPGNKWLCTRCHPEPKG